MKKYLLPTLVALTVYVLFYLIGAFIAVDFNIKAWDEGGRAMVAIMGTIIAFAAFGFSSASHED